MVKTNFFFIILFFFFSSRRRHTRSLCDWSSDVCSSDLNYLYSADELAPWITRVRKIAERARETFVVTNNHFQGKSVVNALQLISILKGSKVKVPEPLRQQYRQLEAIADTPPVEPTLFPLAGR